MPRQILIQLDVDDQPSTFDAVVAFDSGVDHLLRHGDVTPENVTGLIHGAMFTRGGDDLKSTAVFIGGSDVARAEAVLDSVQETFFGPVRVSVMLDANGCNTTAAAAVAAASRHVESADSRAVVLGGTGPVGRRVAQMLASQHADVILTSRKLERAHTACQSIVSQQDSAKVRAAAPQDSSELANLMQTAQVIIACGAAGVELVDAETLASLEDLLVAIDLNAVPPSGLGGIAVTDKAKSIGDNGAVAYGAIGVGGLKMKTHKAAIAKLFETNDAVLDAAEIFAMAQSIDANG
ncbi:MAG: NADP-dependent methylenetetrahydromethanopterin/methylenetetrahydrofolate dehydrogenase [Planctomycetota bacterium]